MLVGIAIAVVGAGVAFVTNDGDKSPTARSQTSLTTTSPTRATPAEPANVHVFTEGECRDAEATSVPCSALHTSETFGTFDVAGNRELGVTAQMHETCSDLFALYTGMTVEEAQGRYAVMEGAGGDPSDPRIQNVQCILLGPRGALTPLTGTARQPA